MLVINTLQRLEIVFWYHLGRVYFHFKFLHLPYIIHLLGYVFKVLSRNYFCLSFIIVIIVSFSNLSLVNKESSLVPEMVKISHAQENRLLYPEGLFFKMSDFKISVPDFGVCISSFQLSWSRSLFSFWMSILPYFYLSRYHIFFVFSLLLSPFRNLYRIYFWDLKSCLFIQVTNLEERGRVKCYQYWPSEGGEAYGDIQVTLMQTVELSDFTIRTLCLKKANSRTERTVNQYHYTIWPDHGVPTCATSVLTFVRKASGANPPDSGPMVSYRQIL